MDRGQSAPPGGAAPGGVLTVPAAGPSEPAPAARTVTRARTLPGGRAVVGALLIAAAAVGVAGAYLSATAAPSTAYVVAAQGLEPGTRFDSVEQVRAVLGSSTVELPPTLASRAIPADQLDGLVGSVLLAPLARGDLLQRTALVDGAATGDDHTLSFALSRQAAVGGALRPGERIDVVATYGSGTDATTTYIVRDVPLVAVTTPDGGVVGAGSELTLTVTVPRTEDVLALGHAVSTADVFVTRSGSGGAAAPDSFQPPAVGRSGGPLDDAGQGDTGQDDTGQDDAGQDDAGQDEEGASDG